MQKPSETCDCSEPFCDCSMQSDRSFTGAKASSNSLDRTSPACSVPLRAWHRCVISTAELDPESDTTDAPASAVPLSLALHSGASRASTPSPPVHQRRSETSHDVCLYVSLSLAANSPVHAADAANAASTDLQLPWNHCKSMCKSKSNQYTDYHRFTASCSIAAADQVEYPQNINNITESKNQVPGCRLCITRHRTQPSGLLAFSEGWRPVRRGRGKPKDEKTKRTVQLKRAMPKYIKIPSTVPSDIQDRLTTKQIK